jgi:hypothetical protein
VGANSSSYLMEEMIPPVSSVSKDQLQRGTFPSVAFPVKRCHFKIVNSYDFSLNLFCLLPSDASPTTELIIGRFLSITESGLTIGRKTPLKREL